MTVPSPSQAAQPAASQTLTRGAPVSWSSDRKLAVLTGASGGIGALIGQDLIERGYRIVALCRSAPPLDPDHCLHIPCDLGSASSLTSACAALQQQADRVDALIHCAGTIAPAPVVSTAAEDIAAQIALNLAAPALLTRLILPMMPGIKKPGEEKPGGTDSSGRIVFVNSMAAVMPLSGSAVYAASKAGLRSFALSLAQEVGPLGIRVSSVFPGAVKTDMLRREMAAGGSVLNYVSTPLAPEKVARAVVSHLFHRRCEQFLPAIDGIFGKLCMLAPPLLRLTLPLLGYLGRRGYAKALSRG